MVYKFCIFNKVFMCVCKKNESFKFSSELIEKKPFKIIFKTLYTLGEFRWIPADRWYSYSHILIMHLYYITDEHHLCPILPNSAATLGSYHLFGQIICSFLLKRDWLVVFYIYLIANKPNQWQLHHTEMYYGYPGSDTSYSSMTLT